MNDVTYPKGSFLLAPAVFLLGAFSLVAVWAVMEPTALRTFFDQNGYSPFELATVPFFAAIVPLVWWKCPFTGSHRRRTLLCLAVSVVALMAVVKELDLHNLALHWLCPDVVGADGKVQNLVRPDGRPLTGTPFKMRFLTNASAPFAAKAFVLFYFTAFFGVFAATLGYFAVPFVKGVFKLHPVAWTVGCFGASGVLVQLCDRLPAWYRHACGVETLSEAQAASAAALCTALEEGGEMMIAVFALLAIVQAHRLYGKRAS